MNPSLEYIREEKGCWNGSKTYGFIFADEENIGYNRRNLDGSYNKDIYFHFNNVHSAKEHKLKTGDKVAFIYNDDDVRGAMDVWTVDW